MAKGTPSPSVTCRHCSAVPRAELASARRRGGPGARLPTVGGVRAGADGPTRCVVSGVRQNLLHRRHQDLASPGRRRGFLCVNCPCSNVFTPMSSWRPPRRGSCCGATRRVSPWSRTPTAVRSSGGQAQLDSCFSDTGTRSSSRVGRTTARCGAPVSPRPARSTSSSRMPESWNSLTAPTSAWATYAPDSPALCRSGTRRLRLPSTGIRIWSGRGRCGGQWPASRTDGCGSARTGRAGVGATR